MIDGYIKGKKATQRVMDQTAKQGWYSHIGIPRTLKDKETYR